MSADVNKPTLGTKTKSICLSLNVPKRIPRRHTMVVLGVERGGTSMAAGVLRALGVPMGERAGLNHEDPVFLNDEPEKLQRSIRTRNQQHELWGFKVPKASMQLPFYEKTLRNPYYVVVFRNPLSVADSWRQRGAGDTVDVLARINAYQNAIQKMVSTTKAPVLFVNYERAVADEASKAQTVSEFASFAGIELTDELQSRAVGMMTGDGKGYVNLPEHFFLVKPAKFDGDRPAIELTEQVPEHRDTQGWVAYEKPQPKIIYKLSDYPNLPRKFWLEIDLQSEGLDLSTNPIRFFFNFTGAYFPGHCVRPRVRKGRNVFWVETSGNAHDIGFGVITMPSRLNIRARAYLPDESDEPTAEPENTQGALSIVGKPGLLARGANMVARNGS